MIYTVTFNPSLDYIVTVDHFKAGEINRTAGELIYPGGKGINVSIVLKNLGYDNTATNAGTEKWGAWNLTKYGSQLATMARMLGIAGTYVI